MGIPRKGSQAHLNGSDPVFCFNPPVPLDKLARIETSKRERDMRPEHREVLRCYGRYAPGAQKPSVSETGKEDNTRPPDPASVQRLSPTPTPIRAIHAYLFPELFS